MEATKNSEEKDNRDREKEKEKEKEDKLQREKEREKEERYKEKEDAKGDLQIHISVADHKEPEREDRDRKEAEKEKDRKDRFREKEKEKEFVSRERGFAERDRERGKDRDRELHRRERLDREEKDIKRIREDRVDKGSGIAESNGNVEDMDVDRRHLKELEDRKETDKCAVKETPKDREREREVDGDKNREKFKDHEKHRGEDGVGDGVVHGEKDKDGVVSHGVQQRKRMLRPRGSSQVVSRDVRSRFRPKETDMWNGRSEMSALVYKVGEGLPELTRLWKDFLATNPGNTPSTSTPTIEIRIAPRQATTSNRQVRGSQLWGTDIYTDDSDLVSVLMHTGYYSPTGGPPPPSILDIRAVIRVLPPQDSYKSTLRNNIRSRAWGAASGCSFSVERCYIIKSGGESIELEPCLNRIPAVVPTLAPTTTERTVTTRAASSNAYRQHRFVQEVTIQYNLCNEPWLKYSMSYVADRGLKKSQYTSARLRKGDVLYVETHTKRYELSYDGERMTSNGAVATTATSAPQLLSMSDKVRERWGPSEKGSGTCDKDKIHGSGHHNHNGDRTQTHGNNGDKHHTNGGLTIGDDFDRYKWARCKWALPLSSMRSKGIPLPADFVEVFEDGLAWEDIQWSPTGVWVKGKEYTLARAQFLSPHTWETTR